MCVLYLDVVRNNAINMFCVHICMTNILTVFSYVIKTKGEQIELEVRKLVRVFSLF